MTTAASSPNTVKERPARPVAAVIVNWNTADLLDECLTSLREFGPLENIVVVDNGSTDESLTVLRTQWPDVRVIANPENR